MNRLMTAAEVAHYTQVNVRTVYRKVWSGELPHYRVGTALRFKQEEIDGAFKGGKDAKKDRTRCLRNPADTF